MSNKNGHERCLFDWSKYLFCLSNCLGGLEYKGEYGPLSIGGLDDKCTAETIVDLTYRTGSYYIRYVVFNG